MSSPLPSQLDRVLHRWLTRHELPGRAAQQRFAPRLSYGRHFGPPSHDARPAAVLLLLYRENNQWLLPLTLRPPQLVDHASQVCFPGGRMEPGETIPQTATRELHEEIGVSADNFTMLGQLSPIFLYNSNFHVTPCLAAATTALRFTPNSQEVAELIPLPLAVLLDPAHRSSLTIRRRGMCFSAPCWQWRDHRIWGATAMILGEFSVLLKQAMQKNAINAEVDNSLKST